MICGAGPDWLANPSVGLDARLQYDKKSELYSSPSGPVHGNAAQLGVSAAGASGKRDAVGLNNPMQLVYSLFVLLNRYRVRCGIPGDNRYSFYRCANRTIRQSHRLLKSVATEMAAFLVPGNAKA